MSAMLQLLPQPSEPRFPFEFCQMNPEMAEQICTNEPGRRAANWQPPTHELHERTQGTVPDRRLGLPRNPGCAMRGQKNGRSAAATAGAIESCAGTAGVAGPCPRGAL